MSDIYDREGYPTTVVKTPKYKNLDYDPNRERGFPEGRKKTGYDSLPSVQQLKTSGEYSSKHNVGYENPMGSEALLYLASQTQGKKNILDKPFVQAFRNTMASKLNNVKDKLAPVMDYTTGEFDEDGEHYLNGMPMDYRYPHVPDQWAYYIKKLREK